MKYGDIANELNSVAHQLTELADKLNKIEAATPKINLPNEGKHPQKILISVAEMAEMMSISKTTAWQLTHRNDFPNIRIGRRIFVPLNKLIAWIDSHCGEEI